MPKKTKYWCREFREPASYAQDPKDCGAGGRPGQLASHWVEFPQHKPSTLEQCKTEEEILRTLRNGKLYPPPPPPAARGAALSRTTPRSPRQLSGQSEAHGTW